MNLNALHMTREDHNSNLTKRQRGGRLVLVHAVTCWSVLTEFRSSFIFFMACFSSSGLNKVWTSSLSLQRHTFTADPISVSHRAPTTCFSLPVGALSSVSTVSNIYSISEIKFVWIFKSQAMWTHTCVHVSSILAAPLPV